MVKEKKGRTPKGPTFLPLRQALQDPAQKPLCPSPRLLNLGELETADDRFSPQPLIDNRPQFFNPSERPGHKDLYTAKARLFDRGRGAKTAEQHNRPAGGRFDIVCALYPSP